MALMKRVVWNERMTEERLKELEEVGEKEMSYQPPRAAACDLGQRAQQQYLVRPALAEACREIRACWKEREEDRKELEISCGMVPDEYGRF